MLWLRISPGNELAQRWIERGPKPASRDEWRLQPCIVCVLGKSKRGRTVEKVALNFL